MTLAVYDTPRAVESPFTKHRKSITGTRHEGSSWKVAVGVLRAAVLNATVHASARSSVNDVGSDVIDRIGELDPKRLHVLALVFGMLLRASKH